MKPLTHNEAKTLLSPYLDGDLTEDEVARLGQVLAEDATLQRELAALREMLGQLDALPEPTPPRDFRARVERRIRDRSRGRFFAKPVLLRRLPFEWFSFVIILALLVLYLFVLSETHQPRSPTAPPSPSAQPLPAADDVRH